MAKSLTDEERITIKRFKERFKDYLKGKEEYLDNIKDRWTNAEVVYIYEWGRKNGKKS